MQSGKAQEGCDVGAALLEPATWIGKGNIADPLVQDIIVSCAHMAPLTLGQLAKKEVAKRPDAEIGELAKVLIAAFPAEIVGRLMKEIVQDFPEEDVGRLVKGRAIVRVENINK